MALPCRSYVFEMIVPSETRIFHHTTKCSTEISMSLRFVVSGSAVLPLSLFHLHDTICGPDNNDMPLSCPTLS